MASVTAKIRVNKTPLSAETDWLYIGLMKQTERVGDDLRRPDVRATIITAAATLIASGGHEAATTRAVALAAGVQAPTIYRLFGDKDGLLDAVAEHGLAAYVAGKALRTTDPDPVEALRTGWDMHVEFSLAHPTLFAIMSRVPHTRPRSPAAEAGLEVLRSLVRNIALAGRLRVSEDRALSLLQAVSTGTVLTLLTQINDQRDPGLSDVAREGVIAAITGPRQPKLDAGAKSAATALRASLGETHLLTAGEQALLTELLDRIADDREPPGRV